MNLGTALRTVIDPTLRWLLPARMDTPQARAQLLAIALQESGMRHRIQQGTFGPLPHLARSYWQGERTGGMILVLEHERTKSIAHNLCQQLDIVPEPGPVHEAMAWNDHLACGLARLLIWTLPTRLPEKNESMRGWEQYIQAWRPGKPRFQHWSNSWFRAWTVVES